MDFRRLVVRPAVAASWLLPPASFAVLVAVLAILLLAPGLSHGAAAADAPKPGRRIALVIGIDAYQHADHLRNPVNDARAVGGALRAVGFTVTDLFDPDERRMAEGIREFGVAAQSAEVALVYYAGHGVQVDHENYLLPADARLQRERDLLYEALPLNLVLGEVSQASKIGIVLLDSCRDNPFVKRISASMRQSGRPTGISVGLARVDNVPRNTLVAMATRADEVAEDGIDHSPFAAALIKDLQVPGLELSLFFRNVHDGVLTATGNRQEPYIFSALGAEPFFLHPRPPSHPPEIGAVTPLEIADNAAPTPLGMPRPTDVDGNPLTIRIVGLPRAGDVRIAGQPVARNASVPLDSFMTATYQPDGHTLGAVGSLDVLIEDDQGNSVAANLQITVLPSHHPAVVEAPRVLRVYPGALRIVPPTSPDGDPLTVVIRALPRGVVRNQQRVLQVGDRLGPADLANLTFMPDPGFAGSAGILLYGVDNGRGDTVEGRIDIEVAATADPGNQVSGDEAPTAALWERLRRTGSAAEVEAFLRLFPAAPAAAAARTRLAELAPARPAVPAAPPAAPVAAPAKPAVVALTAPPPPRPALAPAPPPGPAPVAPAGPAGPPVNASRIIAPIAPPAPEPAAPEPASGTFSDCAHCPVMNRIAGGSFVMGHGAKEPEAMPPHRVTLRAFAIGRYPVTIAEWRACVGEGGCKSMPRMATADGRVPVHNVSWDDAAQFIGWLSRITGQAYRLPSEAEWEYAARGGTTSRYWWGDAIGVSLANCLECGGAQNPRAPMAVDLYKPNPFGLVGMLGGVAQWVADCWAPNYQGAPADGAPRMVKTCESRVLRGGSFRSGRDALAVTARDNYDQSVRYPLNGFRVARDLRE